ncbi:MAG: hypothetical protein V4547_20430 [Bacteroidota bacterium]
MSATKEIFYNLFWQNIACRNLFLLSKEEFLDTKTIELEGNTTSISFPRIILSNVQDDEHLRDKIKLRTETMSIKAESQINDVFEKYAPMLGVFLETKFGKSVEHFVKDFEKEGISLVWPIMRTYFTNKSKFEKKTMQLLQKYGFIGKHICTFQELENYIQKEAIAKNFNTLVSEQNLWTFFELLKAFKDMYVNEAFKGLYKSNQILVSSFHDIDNFEDRLKLFSHLYESDIIKPSKEDSFIECTSCPPSTYKGVFQLKIDPKKLQKFACPICNTPLTYYVPYELDKDIYEIVKTKDGLLLDALVDKLKRNKINCELNKIHLNDIEIDCIYKLNNIVYVVECKMYKQITTPAKLKSKFKEHYSKLIKDVVRIQKEANQPIKGIIPILLVNINDDKLLMEALQELKSTNPEDLYQRGQILTINKIPV